MQKVPAPNDAQAAATTPAPPRSLLLVREEGRTGPYGTHSAELAEVLQKSPAMRHYFALRDALGVNVVLFLKFGDFYEVIGDDAAFAAKALGVTLTKRAGVPMCGVPCWQIEAATKLVVRAGRSAAVCEKVGDAPTRVEEVVG